MGPTTIGSAPGDEEPRSLSWVQVDAGSPPPRPGDPDSALAALNAGHVELPVDGSTFGLPTDPSGVIAQTPFVAGLGCYDARVPLEMIFGLTSNDMFVVRVAGNVPSSASLGSRHYAVAHLPTVTVVGHSHCGAVTAAVDALLSPVNYLALIHDPPLRLIIDALLGGVRIAAIAIEEAQGSGALAGPRGREELILVATVANTAITAFVLSEDLAIPVAFGIHELHERAVGLYGPHGWTPDSVTLRATTRNSCRSFTPQPPC